MMSTWQKYLITTLAACGFAANAMAQYIWLDEKGVKQFSDTPPPASVPKKRIIKEPGGAPARTAPADSADNGEKAAAPKGPMTTAERNADFNKRRAAQAEKEKKDAEADRLAADKAKNCARARDYKSALEAGQRISQPGKNGENTLLNDEQRNQELQETKRFLEGCS